MTKRSIPLQLIGFVRYSKKGAGFALPILRGEDGFPAIQIVDDRTGMIHSFKKIDLDDGEVIDAKGDFAVRLGRPPIFIFIRPDGTPLVGPIGEISEELEKLSKNSSISRGVWLQILERIGTEEELRRARATMHEQLKSGVGSGTARSFRNSMAREVLWDLLISQAPDSEAVNRIKSVRGEMQVDVKDDGFIHLDISMLDGRDYGGLDIKQIEYNIKLGIGFVSASEDGEGALEFEDVTDEDLIEFDPSEVRDYLVRRVGMDARIASWNYGRLSRLLKALGFESLAEVDIALRPYSAVGISEVVGRPRIGQVGKFELLLLAALGDQFLHRTRGLWSIWSRGEMLTWLKKMKMAGISTGAYVPVLGESQSSDRSANRQMSLFET